MAKTEGESQNQGGELQAKSAQAESQAAASTATDVIPPAEGVTPAEQATPLSSDQTAAAIQTGAPQPVQPITEFQNPTQQGIAGGNVYTVEENVEGTLSDGRTYLVAAKGTQMPMVQAEALGLLKPAKAQGPSEKKPARGGREQK